MATLNPTAGLCLSGLLWISTTLGFTAATAVNDPARDSFIPSTVQALHSPGIHNFFALTTDVFSGSTPENEEAFAELARLGVKTIITVDGAQPDVESARNHGIRYVHLPHGYDGISAELQLRLTKAARQLPGPIYVHCHHGKHRGPAAAAVICMADHGWTSDQAKAWLVAAGTATNYAGLYDAVQTFQRPTTDQLRAVSSEFPESAAVSGLVESMVDIDLRWEHLRAVRAAGYRPPADHPDIAPVHEAILLSEHYRESQRLPDVARRGSDLIDRLKSAEAEAAEAARLLNLFAISPRTDNRDLLNAAFDAVGQSCASCHWAHRDPSTSRPAQ